MTIGVPPGTGLAVPDGRWLQGLASGQNRSCEVGLTAHAGGGQSNGTLIPQGVRIVEFDTVASSADSAVLPFAYQIGSAIVVLNSTANSLSVYANPGTNPATGSADSLNGSTSSAVTVAANSAISFFCAKAGVWTASVADQGWEAIDGSANAPTGSAQYPTYFTSLNGISPYPVRPPWKVAGVDYRTGINTGVVLTDPSTVFPNANATIGSSLGAGQNSNTLQIAQDCTLNGFDFTLSGGYTIVTNGHNVTISNSKLQNLCVFAATSTSNVTLLYNTIDGLGASAETTFGAVILLQTGVTLVAHYNWIKNAGSDIIDMTTQNIDARYNLFDTMGWTVGAHADAIQFAGAGTANNILIEFNTYVQSQLGVEGPSSFIDLETQVDAGATMNNPVVGYNVATYTATGSLTTVTGAANNGSGLVRLTVANTANLANGSFKQIAGVGGVPGANGNFLISVISAGAPGTIDLLSSTFSGAYTSGGTVRSIGSTFYRIAQTTGTINGAQLLNNYADFNSFMIAILSASSPGSGFVKSGNIELETGNSF